jgi:hypothetical protein
MDDRNIFGQFTPSVRVELFSGWIWMGYMWIHTFRVEAEYMGGYIWVDMDAYFKGRSSIYIGRVYR